MNLFKISFFIFLAIPCILYAQKAPRIEWQTCLGGTGEEDDNQSFVQTSDGGYAIAGRTGSRDVSGIHGGNYDDIWVIKLSPLHTIEWQKCLGGSGSDITECIIETSDKGFAIAGYTNSTDGDISGFHGGVSDAWIVKLDSLGNIQWQKCIGGNDSGGRDLFEYAYSIIQTADGGYAVAGSTLSTNGDFEGKTHGGGDAWVAKLDFTGNIQWLKCYGGKKQDIAKSIIQNTDGGYSIAGYTYSDEEGFLNHEPLNNPFNSDGYVIRIDSLGNILHGSDNLLWQKLIGGMENDVFHSIAHSTDGGYIVAGFTSSTDGDVSGNHGAPDAWVVKLDSNGNILWQKCFGGSGYDGIYSIIQTNDSGYAFTGVSTSNDGDVSGNNGTSDVWAGKINSTGVIQWQKSLGGKSADEGHAIIQTKDGGYAITGKTNSNDGDVSGNHGKNDIWVVKLSNPLDVQNLSSDQTNFLLPFPNPSADEMRLYLYHNLSVKQIHFYDLLGLECPTI